MGVDEVMLLWSADSVFLCSFNSGSVAMEQEGGGWVGGHGSL